MACCVKTSLTVTVVLVRTREDDLRLGRLLSLASKQNAKSIVLFSERFDIDRRNTSCVLRPLYECSSVEALHWQCHITVPRI